MFRPIELRKRPEEIRRSLRQRGSKTDPLDKALKLDEERRDIIQEVEKLQKKRNDSSERIGELKREGKDEKAKELIDQMSELKSKIETLSDERDKLEKQVNDLLLQLPNLLDDRVPEGEDESDNNVTKEVGTRPDFNFEPLPHWEIAENKNLVDFEQARELSGSRFAVHHGEGARLERALINFMLDVQTQENGYEETQTPFLVREEAMTGTGQLPKFENDMYKTAKDGLYLIPTSEVSLINLYREKILDGDDLPISKTAWTGCFRREAGAHGKDTRGLMRQHQFNKIELVKLCKPENSKEALTELLGDAESILNKLELPYRVVTLCSGDTGFAASYTYDLEVWLPAQERYREISSCSNCLNFQAKRASIQYRSEPEADANYCHTLNGSGLAVGRAWLAIVENFQESDGSVSIPDALRPYMGNKKSIGG